MFMEKMEKWEALKLESVSKEISQSTFIYSSLSSLHFVLRLSCKDSIPVTGELRPSLRGLIGRIGVPPMY